MSVYAQNLGAAPIGWGPQNLINKFAPDLSLSTEKTTYGVFLYTDIETH